MSNLSAGTQANVLWLSRHRSSGRVRPALTVAALSALGLLGLAAPGYAQVVDYPAPGTFTYTVPAGVTALALG